MVNSEKLCLQWNEFHKIVKSAFEELRDDNYLTDVTLVCNDGKQVEAHKVVLASTSPFFMELFKRNKHPHPLVFMRGVKGDDLMAMVEFLYNGEANVDQENLDTFLALANDLRLKGLNGKSEEGGENSDQVPPPSKVYEAELCSSEKKIIPLNDNQQNGIINHNQMEKALALINSTDKDLDNQIRSMMRKSENNLKNFGHAQGKSRICKVCGKEGTMATIQKHIESNHITGFTHDCTVCGFTLKTRNALGTHMYNKHNNK